MEVGNSGHDVRVGVGIVEGCAAGGEGGGGGEGGVGGAEVADGFTAGVVFGRIGYAHVFFHDGDVFLGLGRCC